ncbi:MAG: valine--tRNA ligase [Stappiaceae bacterium]
MLEKTYDASAVEPRIYQDWEKSGAFKAGAGAVEGADPYCIVIPPPNVTGSLHMGHALNNTLQDILIRYHRMQGRDVLWQPGMDHAGIATQMVVERQLMEKQLPGRRDMGREAFVQRVWDWKAESGGIIFNQLRRLGASCDWDRERFTMDEGLSKAVLEVFVRLYKDGLLYKDKRLVNWDPKFHTAISDLEVEQTEVNGNLWHFRYPIEGMEGRYVVVATTRPETMLGDTAVAVNPEDERYSELIGKHVVLPLVGRRIPIVADDYADPEAGSGAVKITPAHDFNDFEVGKRHALPMISIMNREATIALKDNEAFLDDVPESSELTATIRALDGQDRFVARKLIVQMFEEQGLLEQIEDHVHMVPHGDRSHVPIEPYLTDQWYVDAKTLAEPAIDAVRNARTKFVPKNWEKTYYDWMENIQPWCVSRQLWWGHQIPAWYGPDGEIFVAKFEHAAAELARAHYGRNVTVVGEKEARESWEKNDGDTVFLHRDEDVLDTWFSSALWPFSTLGWPENTETLARYYPTSVLITGFDIIFFWVARMMMAGIHFMETEPFDTVYIHALVRDEHGAKMSKSKGNVIDPLQLIDEYSADALRFTLAAMAAQGRDIKLATSRVEGYRNFSTKLWNAARFAEMNECVRVESFDAASVEQTVNRWIVAETAQCAGAVTAALKEFRFNEAAGAIYRFVWNTYCDWYLELIKPLLNGDDEQAKAEVRATAAWALDEILKILHPFMPFLTEELWLRTGETGPARQGQLITTRWPDLEQTQSTAADEINWLIGLITDIRSVRAEMNVPAGGKVPLVFVGAAETTKTRLDDNAVMLARLARVDAVSFADTSPKGAAQIVVGEATVCLPLAGVIDLEAEMARQRKDENKLSDDIARIDKKLANPKFVEKAPQEVVAGERDKREELLQRLEKVKAAIIRLEEAS